MNKDWSDKNKEFQKLISKEATFSDGIKKLLDLRSELFDQIVQAANTCQSEDFWKMPFAGANGYHSKTVAYSIWHIFRIEDIVCHTLIQKDKQVLAAGKWQKKINASIITTGNELQGKAIEEFSKKLNVPALIGYAQAVMASTDSFLRELDFKMLKQTFNDEDRENLIECGGVSEDENASWLIDYWCGKNQAGLLKMPFSRHWIMHIEAMLRIKNKLNPSKSN